MVIIIVPDTFSFSLLINSRETEYQLTKSPIIIFFKRRLCLILSSNLWFSKETSHLASLQNILRKKKLINALQTPIMDLENLQKFLLHVKIEIVPRFDCLVLIVLEVLDSVVEGGELG